MGFVEDLASAQPSLSASVFCSDGADSSGGGCIGGSTLIFTGVPPQSLVVNGAHVRVKIGAPVAKLGQSLGLVAQSAAAEAAEAAPPGDEKGGGGGGGDDDDGHGDGCDEDGDGNDGDDDCSGNGGGGGGATASAFPGGAEMRVAAPAAAAAEAAAAASRELERAQNAVFLSALQRLQALADSLQTAVVAGRPGTRQAIATLKLLVGYLRDKYVCVFVCVCVCLCVCECGLRGEEQETVRALPVVQCGTTTV
jgi:hypothetical protein